MINAGWYNVVIVKKHFRVKYRVSKFRIIAVRQADGCGPADPANPWIGSLVC